MAGKAVSYQFLDALAKSVGMDAETVKQALAEISQLQTQTQELELAVQGKAPTNHASQQSIFGTANEQMYGHVKIAHEVTNDSTDGVAVSPDAVYAYCQANGMAAEMPASGDYLTSTVFSKIGNGSVSLTKNGQLCVTGTVIFQASVPADTHINTLAFDNALKIRIPCLTFGGPQGFYLSTKCTYIDEDGFLNADAKAGSDSKLVVVITPGIYPIFANKE